MSVVGTGRMRSPSIDRDLLDASLPIAAILLFWGFLSWFAPHPIIGGGLRNAGVLMAALYVVVRGFRMSRSLPEPLPADGPTDVLRENARVALTAGVWFVAAVGVVMLQRASDMLTDPAVTYSPADPLILVCVGAGVGTVGIYAVAAGVAAVREGTGARPAPSDD